MTDKEINRATITAFLARAINRAAASAVDAEFGLRVVKAEVIDQDRIRIDLTNDHIVIVDALHLVPRDPLDPQKLFDAINRGLADGRHLRGLS